MRLGLTARVVFTVVLLAVGVVALDAVVTRWAFQSRFLDYVGDEEEELLGDLAAALARYQGVHGSLEALTARRALLRFLGDVLLRDRLAGERLHRLEPLLDDRPGPPREPRLGHRDHGPLLRSDLAGEWRERDFRHRLGTFLPRLSISLADGSALLARRIELPGRVRSLRREVVFDGVPVAVLELLPVRELVRERDRRFARDHLAAIWWIGALAAALACVVGWLLARRLVGPLQAVAAGARALAAGRHNIELPADRSDELGALARDFNTLARTLAASSRARERWMADIAHELRTPVAVLRGELDALRDGVRSLTPEALGSLDAEISRLARLVDDLHDLTLADAGALAYRFEDIDLRELVDAVSDRYRDRLADARLSLQWTRPEVSLPCRADPRRLDQLLVNLLENALRYTDAPGPIRIRLERIGTTLRLTVEDGPPGVPTAELKRLFERFHRVEGSRSRASGGAGLGLAIAERIVTAHGGTIRARESTLGGLAVDVEFRIARGE